MKCNVIFQVTHIGLRSISENNPSIEYLYLNQCLGVTDEAVQIIAQNLRRLRALGLQVSILNQFLRHPRLSKWAFFFLIIRITVSHCIGLSTLTITKRDDSQKRFHFAAT